MKSSPLPSVESAVSLMVPMTVKGTPPMVRLCPTPLPPNMASLR